jgi:hypothetical protein
MTIGRITTSRVYLHVVNTIFVTTLGDTRYVNSGMGYLFLLGAATPVQFSSS